MANVQIYQLDNVGSDLDSGALLACDVELNGDKVTRKVSVSALETQILNTEEYTTGLDTTSKTITGAINELKSGKLDKSNLHYGTGTNFDNNGVCTIDITSWGLSARPDVVFVTGCWVESAIITYDRTNSTATSLKFICYDSATQARRTGTNVFNYLVIT